MLCSAPVRPSISSRMRLSCMKESVHRTRSGSAPNVVNRWQRRLLLTLLNADLMSTSRAPAAAFLFQASCVRDMSTAAASTVERLCLRSVPHVRVSWSPNGWPSGVPLYALPIFRVSRVCPYSTVVRLPRLWDHDSPRGFPGCWVVAHPMHSATKWVTRYTSQPQRLDDL